MTQQIKKGTNINSEIENAINKITNSVKLLNSILDIDEEKSSGLKCRLEENICNNAQRDQRIENIGKWARQG